MSQELRDLFEGAQFTLDESKSKKFEGVLATVKGPFGLTEDTNRNGRIYTNKFWEYQLGQPEVKSRLSERAVIGELEHPNSIQTKLGHISHVVTDLKVIPDKKELYGEADILDTPSGRILHTLFKAGVKVGISSRGAGSLVEEGTGEGKKKYVKKEDYVFGGFDFVSDPSAPNAFPELAEGQVEELREALEAHADEIGKDTSFYAPFLESLGVAQVLQEEAPVELMSEGDTTPTDLDGSDLDEQAATISDLRSKMRQMVERHREMSSQMEIMREKLEQKEDHLLRCEDLTRAVGVQKAKALSLSQQMEAVGVDLVEARKKLDQFREMDRENMNGVALREKAFSQEIANLKDELAKSNQDLVEHQKLIESLESKVSNQKSLVESKADKISIFRRELLESLAEQFNCDIQALAEGLRPGFTPEEAVSRAAACSRSLHSSALPLGGDFELDEAKDLDQPDDPNKTALKERRKGLLRAARGRKN